MKNLKRIGLFLAVLFSAVILIMVFYEPAVNLENEIVLLICNTLFTGFIPIAVSIIMARTYIRLKVDGAFFMCCGMLAYGLGSIITGLLRFTTESSNVSLTVYNSCALISSLFCIYASMHETGFDYQACQSKKNKRIMTAALAALVLMILLITYAATKNVMPAFIDENGFTTLRYGVLFSAVALFFCSAMFYAKQYRTQKNDYFYWYALTLFMFTLGLFGVCLASGIGSFLGWTGRVSQYFGAVFAFIAILVIYQQSAHHNTAFTEVMVQFFSNAKESYYYLANTSPDAIISINQDFKIFIANASAYTLLNTEMDKLSGRSLLDFLEQPYKNELQQDINSFLSTGQSRIIGQKAEAAIRIDGGCTAPVELSVSSRKLNDRYTFTLVIRDITERKNAEEALQNALRFNSEILESISDGFFSLDSDWHFTYVNQRASEHVGYKTQELIGRIIWEMFPSLLGTKTAEYYRRAMDEKVTIRFEHRWANSKQCYNFSVYPTLNGISVYWQDMTERKLAEEKLRESEERFRIAQEISPDGFTIFHPLRDDSGAVIDFIWVYENDAIARLNGTSPKQVIGKRLLEWMPGHQGTQLFEAYKHVATTGESQVLEEVSYVGDTMPIITWFRLVVVSMGEDIAILAQDITARKQTEEALQASNSKISMILKSIQDDFFVLDRDWTIVYTNPNFTSKFGKDPADFVDRNFWETFPKYLGTILEENYRAAMETGERREFELYGPYTNEWYRLKLYPSEDGLTILGTVITAYKRVGEALRESEYKARVLVEELRKADQNKNEFLNALSHELRNPLATIVSGTSLMGMLETNPKTRHVLDIVKRQTNQLCRLIDDLLEVTRITNNKIQLKKEIIDLNKLVVTILHDHQMLYSEKGVEINLHTYDYPVHVNADPARMTQIIGNLLYNALKFTDTGGQTVLSVYAQENTAYISVEDNGTGIASDFLPELFEPFKQANSTLARSSGGLGLGLAIVKGITELHGGTVSAYSEGLGKGSRFTISLPLCLPEKHQISNTGSNHHAND